MARTEKQLQAAYDKGKISLREFHEALSKIGTAVMPGYCQEKEPGQHVIDKMVLKRRKMGTKYLSCAETAKLVRTALKKNFPGVKFSVRSSVYSGGASIDVSWVLGPTTKEVDSIAGQYESADFDGSIDMETRYDHWLLPDGSAIIKHVQVRKAQGLYSGGGKPNARWCGAGIIRRSLYSMPASICRPVAGRNNSD